MSTWTTEDRKEAEKIMNNERSLAKEITEGFEALKSMRNNEPVAWMEADVLPLTHIIKAVVRREQDEQHTIPLYTATQFHPAKTLTDEEISQVYKEVSEPFGEKRLYEIHDFARAILRKAQEK
jgi:hypothetical protein